MDCYRRFPWLSLPYLHFLELSRHRWISDRDTRDATREYLFRLLGRAEGKTIVSTTAEAAIDLDLKVPALFLLAHIQRKANQFNLVIEVVKSGLEAIKAASDTIGKGAPVFTSYWRSFMNLLAEAFHRTRQLDNAALTYETVMKREPTNPVALKVRSSNLVSVLCLLSYTYHPSVYLARDLLRLCMK